MANRHIGEVALETGEGRKLLLVFDGTAYAHLEDLWDLGMKGVLEKISGWDENNLRLSDMGDLLTALTQRHQPDFTRMDALDLIGFPTPDMKVVDAMMQAVQASLPKASDIPAGEAVPPKAKAAKPANGTGSKPSRSGSKRAGTRKPSGGKPPA